MTRFFIWVVGLHPTTFVNPDLAGQFLSKAAKLMKNSFCYVLFRAIRAIRGHIPANLRQSVAGNGRKWQNLAERYSLVQVQTFQYVENERVTKNKDQKTPECRIGRNRAPWFVHNPLGVEQPRLPENGERGCFVPMGLREPRRPYVQQR